MHQTLLINHPTTPGHNVLLFIQEIELLKDQFAEIYKEARKLDQFLMNKSCQKIIIAPLFGDIPTGSYSFKSKDFSPPWKQKKSDGYLCPFLQCPKQNCGGDLLWKKRYKSRHRKTNLSKM